MNEQILGGQQQFEMIVQNTSQNPDDLFFNHAIQILQQIIINSNFQKTQTEFMRQNCEMFQNIQQNHEQCVKIYEHYQKIMNPILEKMLSQKINNFKMQHFFALLTNKKSEVDEQIYQILMSLIDFNAFRQLMGDYRASQEQQERFRVLTIKSTKAPEHKKIKGATQNIFGSANVPLFGTSAPKKKPKNEAAKKQKTQQQLLIPDLVLTVRPLRKG